MASPNDGTRDARLAWPDAARGLSVVLIVMLHLWVSHLIFWIDGQTTVRVIEQIIIWTSPLRIPLFFFVSGFLASRSLERPWRTAWRGRVFSISYLYVLWVAVVAVVLQAQDTDGGSPVGNIATMVLRNVGSPETHMWYLWALVVLFVAVWFTRHVRWWAVVSVAGLVSCLAPFLLDQPYRQVAAAALFFAIGARAPVVAAWLTSRRGIWIFIGGAAAYVTSIMLGPTGPYGLADPVTSTIGVAATVAVIGAVADRPWMALLRWIGRNTLPIFILNPLAFILLNNLLLRSPDVASALAEWPGAGSVYTVLVLVGTLAASVGFKAVADRVGLAWLFSMPARWLASPVRST